MFNSVKLNIVAVTNRILLDKFSRDIGCSNNGGDTSSSSNVCVRGGNIENDAS